MLKEKTAIDYDEFHRAGRSAIWGDVYDRARREAIIWIIERHLKGENPAWLVDVGTGEGRYLEVWHSFFPAAYLTGLEYSVLAAHRSAPRHPYAAHVIASGDALPLAEASQAGLVSVEVIEHVPDGREMLAECYRVLKPGGWALITTPCGNRGSLEYWLNWFSGQIKPGLDDGVLFGKTEDPTHLRRYRSQEFVGLCRAAGFEVEQVFYKNHGFALLGQKLEPLVKSRINLERRSVRLAEAFDRSLDILGGLDWRLFKHLPFGSAMALVLRKPEVVAARA